jgi:arginyl-tRNA synthetase
LIAQDIGQLLATAIKKAQKKGDLPPFDIPQISVERPKDPSHGDYAPPVAMGLARYARMAPRKIAETIIAHLPSAVYLARWLWLTPASSTCAWPIAGWLNR